MSDDQLKTQTKPAEPSVAESKAQRLALRPADKPPEHGGPKGPEPTRFGDWERKGRCVDF